MKFLASTGLQAVSSSLGDPNRIKAMPSEREAWLSAAAQMGVWIPSSSDFQSLPDGTDIECGYLWNWPAAGASFGDPRPEPLLGWVITFAVSDLQKVVGAQLQVEWTWFYQPAQGYTLASPPGRVYHTALFDFVKSPQGSTLLGIIPAQVVNGRTVMSLPYIKTDNTYNSIKLSGLPAGTTARVRALTRHDVDLPALWPELVPAIYGK